MDKLQDDDAKSDNSQGILGDRQPLIATAILWFAALLTGYWWWSYSGLYQWIAEAQLAVIGMYEAYSTAAATYILTVVLTTVAIGLPFVVWRRFGTRGDEEMTSHFNELAEDAVQPDQAPQIAPTKSNKNQVDARVLAWVALAALAFGAIVLAQTPSNRSLFKTTAADIEAGVALKSRFMEIEGLRLADATLWMEVKHSKRVFTPLVSESWDPDRPVCVLIETKGGDSKMSSGVSHARVRGMRNFTGVPGMMRVEFERMGLLTADAIVITADSTPANQMRMGIACTVLGGAGVILAAVVLLIERRRACRTSEPAWPGGA